MSTSSQDIQTLMSFFKSVNFTQPLSIGLLSTTIDAINSEISGDDLRSTIADKVPSEVFVLQEVMATSKFYDRFRSYLNLMDIETPSTRSTRDMLVVRILSAIYGEDTADQTFTVFKENRKSMRLNPLSDWDLYGNDESIRPPPPTPLTPFTADALSSLSADQMRSIIAIIFAKDPNPGADEMTRPPDPISTSNPTSSDPIFDGDVTTGANNDSANNRYEPKFKLEIALGRLQSYYSKAQKFSGDFEEDLDDSLAEFNTCLLYTSPSPRDQRGSRMPSSA